MFKFQNKAKNNNMRITCKISLKKALNSKFEPTGTIKIYIFNIICIKKIKIKKYIVPKTEKIKEENDKFIHRVLQNREGLTTLIEIVRKIKIENFKGIFNVNLYEPILNAYIIALLNSLIPIILSLTDTSLKNNNIKYETGISNDILDVKISGIISIPIVQNISSILKLLFIFLKGGTVNGRKTSNRISNDYINDIN